MLLPGLLSVTFRQRSCRDIVAFASRAGLAGIEWGGDVHVPSNDPATARTVRRMTEDAGLQVSAYGSYYRAGQSEAAGVPFSQVLETAVALGAPLIRVWAGSVGSSAVGDVNRAAVVADLRRAAERAAEAGVGVATEWHGNTLTDSTESAVRLLREVGHANLGTLWQPRIGDAVDVGVADLRMLGGLLRAVHVFHWWPTVQDRRPLVEGETAWSAYLSEVSQVSDGLFASLEFLPHETEADLRRDASTLKRWLDRENSRAVD